MTARYSDAEREALSQLPERFSSIFDGTPPSAEWLEDFRRKIEGSRHMVASYGRQKSDRKKKHADAIRHALIVAAAIEREQQRLAEVGGLS